MDLVRNDKHLTNRFATTEKSLIFQSHKSYKNPLAARRKPAAQTAHLVFLPTHKPTLKKPKELFFPQIEQMNFEYAHCKNYIIFDTYCQVTIFKWKQSDKFYGIKDKLSDFF